MKKYYFALICLTTLIQNCERQPVQQKLNHNIEINQSIIASLDTILQDDQKYRIQMDTIGKIYGWESKEIEILNSTILLTFR